jgi:small-conductance mechanosensitive channel
MTHPAHLADLPWQTLAIPGGVLAGVLAAGWLVRRLLFRAVRAWAERTRTQLDDLVIEAFHGPFLLWVLILGLHLATQSSELPPHVTRVVSKTLLVLWILSFTLVAARLASTLIRHYGNTISSAMPVTSLTQNLASIVVITIGLLILLNTLGISITPILTALGVGGLAVALALQDTLANLFAGFYISLAGQVRAGDYVKLDTGEEGYVTDISWRSTTLRVLANNLVVVPNAKLAQAIVTNYNLPERRMSLLIPVGVSYDSDPDLVEKILVEEATLGAAEIPGLLAEPAPFVRFIPGFGDSSLNFTLICQVGEFVDQYLAQHELRKRIFRRFRKEGIEIPFPIRTLYIRRDQDAAPTSGGDAP